MIRFKMAFGVFLIAILVSVGQIVMLGPLLPERVASHFGWNGNADGFMSREAFLASHSVLIAFTSAIFILLPKLIAASPHAAINVPNKSYWLSPARVAETTRFLSERSLSLGAASMALLAGILQLIYEANISGSLDIGSMPGVYVIIYLAYNALWCVTLSRYFRLPRQ